MAGLVFLCYDCCRLFFNLPVSCLAAFYFMLMKFTATIFGLMICCSSFTQTLSTQQLLSAWKASDTSQTTKAELTYADLKNNADTAAYRKRIIALDAYLREHPNGRLQIRTWMYEILGKFELDLPLLQTDKEHLKSAVKMADLMNDNQLLSELYSLYPRLEETDESNSYYILKSIEMQRKIGAGHFPLLYLRMLNFSISRYNAGEYNQAIAYGHSALELLDGKATAEAGRIRILQCDYLGASYKRLGIADSVLYYYSFIKKNISFVQDTAFQKIWDGIADGGIGYAFVLQQRYEEALPYLYKNIRSSIAYNLYPDAALSEDALGQISFAGKKYDSALCRWRLAYQWYGDDTLGKMNVSQNLSKLFNNRRIYDSAYFYNKQYYLFKTALYERNRNGRLGALKTRIEFNDMESSLQRAKSDIGREKNIRLLLLSGVAFLGVIALLLYNRYRLQQEYLIEQANARHRLVALEVVQAKRQIQVFTDKIREREALIEQLKSDLENNANTKPAFDERLLEYSLVTNEEWDKFRLEFLKAYPAFYPSLQKITGRLTPSEERLAALIHLQLSNRQIAHTLGIARDSVGRSKRRLKQRLGLPENASIESFLIDLR